MGWIERVDWSRRTAELGALRIVDGAQRPFVAAELAGADDDLIAAQWEAWADVRHPNLLEAVRLVGDRRWVRYAAIDWSMGPISIGDPDGTRRVATWGVEIASAFDHLIRHVSADSLAWFACPFVKIDLEGKARVGFSHSAATAAHMSRTAPELIARWPLCDERALVFAIGQLMLSLVAVGKRTSKSPLGEVITRCLAPDPARRYANVGELRWLLASIATELHARRDASAWERIEEGIGFLLIGEPTLALARFESARRHGLFTLADEGIEIALARGANRSEFPLSMDPDLDRPLRDFGNRLVFRSRSSFNRTDPGPPHVPLIDVSSAAMLLKRAKARLDAQDLEFAAYFARRVLELRPRDAEAWNILATAQLARKELRDALFSCDEWLSLAADDARGHYLRAKALLKLGRLVDARDAFERAYLLDPKLLAAMVLKLQLERSIRRLRETVGEGGVVPVDVPAHLRDIRALILAGKSTDAITRLRDDEYASDAAAQLLLADLLAFDGELAEALAAFERAAQLGESLAGRLGAASTLVRAGRAEEALAICDALAGQHPGASEPHEARAQALQALGRADEAETAFKQALAAGAQRSNAHVRLAGR